MTNYLLVAIAIGVLALVGCSKSNEQKPGAHPPGVIDLSNLQQQFPNPTPEVTSSLSKIRFANRYRTFDTGLAELDKLSQMPGITDQQKKAIDELAAQFKAAASAAPPKPTQ